MGFCTTDQLLKHESTGIVLHVCIDTTKYHNNQTVRLVPCIVQFVWFWQKYVCCKILRIIEFWPRDQSQHFMTEEIVTIIFSSLILSQGVLSMAQVMSRQLLFMGIFINVMIPVHKCHRHWRCNVSRKFTEKQMNILIRGSNWGVYSLCYQHIPPYTNTPGISAQISNRWLCCII